MENDSQIIFYSKYKNMYDFVLDVINMYPNENIMIKLHPKSTEEYIELWEKNINTLIKINPKIKIAMKKAFGELRAETPVDTFSTSLKCFKRRFIIQIKKLVK
jgi:hypothetical protein